MLVNHTHERLAALGLPGMAKAFDDQQRQPDTAALTFEVRLGLMIDREVTERDNKRLVARLKFAALRQAAVIEDIDLRTPRGIERAFFAKLVDGDWIAASRTCSSPARPASARAGSPARSATRHAATIVPSSTIACRGCSRPWRWHAATDDMRGCSRAYRGSSSSSSTIGDWLRSPATSAAICSRSSTTDISAARPSSPARCPVDHWHEVIADPTIADAVLDRLVHNAHRLVLRGDSMRKITAQTSSLDAAKKP